MTITLTREEAQQVLDALIWTTGSQDFSETGKARVGAIKVLFPAIETLRARLSAPELEPVTGCACRWNSEDKRIITCERHQGWLDVIAEWADRAREAEQKLRSKNNG